MGTDSEPTLGQLLEDCTLNCTDFDNLSPFPVPPVEVLPNDLKKVLEAIAEVKEGIKDLKGTCERLCSKVEAIEKKMITSPDIPCITTATRPATLQPDSSPSTPKVPELKTVTVTLLTASTNELPARGINKENLHPVKKVLAKHSHLRFESF